MWVLSLANVILSCGLTGSVSRARENSYRLGQIAGQGGRCTHSLNSQAVSSISPAGAGSEIWTPRTYILAARTCRVNAVMVNQILVKPAANDTR
jgi:hypothetical protein